MITNSAFHPCNAYLNNIYLSTQPIVSRLILILLFGIFLFNPISCFSEEKVGIESKKVRIQAFGEWHEGIKISYENGYYFYNDMPWPNKVNGEIIWDNTIDTGKFSYRRKACVSTRPASVLLLNDQNQLIEMGKAQFSEEFGHPILTYQFSQLTVPGTYKVGLNCTVPGSDPGGSSASGYKPPDKKGISVVKIILAESPISDWQPGTTPKETRGLSIHYPQEGATIPGGASIPVIIKNENKTNWSINLKLERARVGKKDVVGNIALPGNKSFYPTEWERVFEDSFQWSSMALVGDKLRQVSIPLNEGNSTNTSIKKKYKQINPEDQYTQVEPDQSPNIYRLELVGIVGGPYGLFDMTDLLYRTFFIGTAVQKPIDTKGNSIGIVQNQSKSDNLTKPPILLPTKGRRSPVTLKFEHDVHQHKPYFTFKFKKKDLKTRRWINTTLPRKLTQNTAPRDDDNRAVTSTKFIIKSPGKYNWTISGQGFIPPNPKEFQVGNLFTKNYVPKGKKSPSIWFAQSKKQKLKPKLNTAFNLTIAIKNIGSVKNDSSHKSMIKINCKALDGGKCEKLIASYKVPTIHPGSKKRITIRKALKVTKGGKYRVIMSLNPQPQATGISTAGLKKSYSFDFQVDKAAHKRKKKRPGASSPFGGTGSTSPPAGTPGGGSGGSSSRRIGTANKAVTQ